MAANRVFALSKQVTAEDHVMVATIPVDVLFPHGQDHLQYSYILTNADGTDPQFEWLSDRVHARVLLRKDAQAGQQQDDVLHFSTQHRQHNREKIKLDIALAAHLGEILAHAVAAGSFLRAWEHLKAAIWRRQMLNADMVRPICTNSATC